MVLGTPMFDKATLRLAGNRTLVITRQGAGIFVDAVTLDGKPYSNAWLPVDRLHSSEVRLEFKMSQEPNKQRGTAVADRPPSFR